MIRLVWSLAQALGTVILAVPAGVRGLVAPASVRDWRCLSILFLCSLLGACGEDPPAASKGGAGGASASKPAAAAGGAPGSAGAAGAPGAKPAEKDLRRKALKDEDFFEGEANRDPFRSFLEELSRDSTGPITVDVKVKFKDYGCEELQLIAIISGGLNPHAMFRDPRKVGLPVRVGDRICKSAAKVVRIVQDAVLIETEEDLGGPKTRPVQKRLEIRGDSEVLLPVTGGSE